MSDVLTRFARGDHAAVAELYNEFGGAVFTVAMSILGNRDLAADATQQTFVKAWKSAETFDPEREFAPWIYSIARRASIDMWRSEKKRHHDVPHESVEVVEMPPGLEEAWETFQVRLALTELSVEEREVVRLTHFGGYTHTQAAEVLGVSVGTVKSRSHRAHRRLAAALGHLAAE